MSEVYQGGVGPSWAGSLGTWGGSWSKFLLYLSSSLALLLGSKGFKVF